MKGFSKQIAQGAAAKKSGAKLKPSHNWLKPDAASVLVAQLNKWPELSAENLHEFRLKIKELLYVLHLSRNADNEFIEALDKAKDEIGDWHDWYQLTKIAEQKLSVKNDRPALKRIEDTSDKKLEVALASAQSIKGRKLNA